MVVSVPWSIENGELGQLAAATPSTQIWLFATAALSGFGFLAQLLLLRDLSPTTLALAQLAAQLSAAALAVLLFTDGRLPEYMSDQTNPMMQAGLLVIAVCLVLFCLVALVLGKKVTGPSGGPNCIDAASAALGRWWQRHDIEGKGRGMARDVSAVKGEHGAESFAIRWRNYKTWSPDWSMLAPSDEAAASSIWAGADTAGWRSHSLARCSPVPTDRGRDSAPRRFRSFDVKSSDDKESLLGPDGYLEAAQELFDQMSPSETAKVLSICVCGYNEEIEEFELSLASLLEQQVGLLNNGYRLRVMIGMDGWGACHDSMRQFCEQAFPPSSYGDWMAELAREDCLGVTMRNPNALFSRLEGGDVGGLDLTVYIKSENRKKDDTLAMFLCGFMIHAMPGGELALLTDAGTAYNDGCFVNLVEHMETHPRCAGATGRIRVDPECPWDPQRFNNWEAKWVRAAQCAEVEMDTIIRYDFTSRIGFMPVLPGPCNIWRMSLISDQFHLGLPGDAESAGSTTSTEMSSAVTLPLHRHPSPLTAHRSPLTTHHSPLTFHPHPHPHVEGACELRQGPQGLLDAPQLRATRPPKRGDAQGPRRGRQGHGEGGDARGQHGHACECGGQV